MTQKECIGILTEYNAWRRGSEIPQPNPKDIGIAIDYVTERLEENMKKTKCTYWKIYNDGFSGEFGVCECSGNLKLYDDKII